MKDYREYIKKQKEKIVDLSTGNRVIEKIEEEIQEMYFKNGKKLESHYDNHGTILGYSTSGEYLNASRNSLEKKTTSTIKSFTSEGNTYFRYDSKTGEFGIMNSYGGVSTYFIPNETELYWEEQVKLYAPKKY